MNPILAIRVLFVVMACVGIGSKVGADGNIPKAAQLLGIKRTTVCRILSQSDSVSG
ncbi:MAG: helix-turn-helix domain-containing protein [Verrucomicrobia bacterium]|nr:helix-turn-helix domain-containing protein [Verrucomicrobiota bacterium]